MGNAKMGRSSRSFLRYRKNASFLGDVKMMNSGSKREIIDFMHRFDINDRAVFFAENLQILTQEEIENIVLKLGNNLEEIGVDGVIEAHPTADATSKSAHFHFWGTFTKKVENIIISFIKENQLSNKINLNYTNQNMRQGTAIRVLKEGAVEYEFDRAEKNNITRKDTKISYDEDEIAMKNLIKKETSYSKILAYCEELESTLNQDIKINNSSAKKININKYIDELEYMYV